MTSAIVSAYEAAVLVLQREGYTAPVPDSLSVKAHLTRWGYAITRAELIAEAKRMKLPLADV